EQAFTCDEYPVSSDTDTLSCASGYYIAKTNVPQSKISSVRQILGLDRSACTGITACIGIQTGIVCISIVWCPVIQLVGKHTPELRQIRPENLITQPYIPFSDTDQEKRQVETSIGRTAVDTILEPPGTIAYHLSVTWVSQCIVARKNLTVTIEVHKANIARILGNTAIRR